MDTATIKRVAQQLANEYDGDHDTMPGLPLITHTDYTLIELINRLAENLEQLERAINDQ